MDIAINFSKIIFLSLCFAFIGCAEKTDIVDLSLTSLNYSLDTIMIDPGNELLHLNAGLRMAALDAERDYLYNFNPSDLC